MEINHEDQGTSDANFHQDPRHDLDHPDQQRWQELQATAAENGRWISEQQLKYEQEQREDRDPNDNCEDDSTYPDLDSVKRVRNLLNRKRKSDTQIGNSSDTSCGEVAGGS